MRKLLALMIVFTFLSAALLLNQNGDPIVSSHTEGTKGIWTAYPGSDSYHFNSSDIAGFSQIGCLRAGFAGSWLSARNSSTGTAAQSGGNLIKVANYYSGVTSEFHRTFIRMNMSLLPIGGVIDHIFLNFTFTGGQTPYTQRTYIVLTPSQYPHDPLNMTDYALSRYDTTNLTVAYQDVDLGVHQWELNSTGRFTTGQFANASGYVYLTFMMISHQDLFHMSGPMNWEILWGDKSSLEMTVVMDGGIARWLPPIPPPDYGDFMDADKLNGIIKTFFWFIGLGGMVVIPMMVVKTTREGEGGMVGKFNGSVFWIGMFIVCLAFFFWAIS